MAIEIEKKYRLTNELKEQLLVKLPQVGAIHVGHENEENMLYRNQHLDNSNSVLRVRKVSGRTILTYKERLPTSAAIKQQIEEETEVTDAAALDAILRALGSEPSLVYEKRRDTWRLGPTEVVIDELPFGLFMEIEGTEEEIWTAESSLGCTDAEAEHETYPQLAKKYGKRIGEMVESRFDR